MNCIFFSTVDFIIHEQSELVEKYLYFRQSQVKIRLHLALRGCAEDEEGNLGVGLQELTSNHLKLLWSKAMVVSV